MVSSISQQSNSLAYEMAQVSASSSLASSTKIERLNYNGLSESEKESLRQKYSAALEEYGLDDLDLYEEIEGLEDEEDEGYLDLSLDVDEDSDSSSSYRADVSSQDEISYYAEKYAQLTDELTPQVSSVNLSLSGYNKFNYSKISSAYAPRDTYTQSNVKVYA